MASWVIKRFETPDRSAETDLGKVDFIEIGGLAVGRAQYQPGWVWSREMGAPQGKQWCEVSHVGLVLRGSCFIEMVDGTHFVLEAGDLFKIEPGHDSRVIGDQIYESLHLVGVSDYIGDEPVPEDQL